MGNVPATEFKAKCLELMDRVGMDIQRPGLGDGSGETDDTYVGDGRVFRSMADQQGVALAALRSQIVETIEYLAAVD